MRDAQLNFIPAPRVSLHYYPRVSPPDGTGPGLGAFRAALAGTGGPSGWGRSETSALAALADHLCEHIAAQPARGALTVAGQALFAAERLPLDGLIAYLRDHSDTPVLIDGVGADAPAA